MSIKSEIDRLAAIKEELKAALAEKGQTVGEVFSTYPDAVRAIQTGGKTATLTIDVDESKCTAIFFDGETHKSLSGLTSGQSYPIQVPSLLVLVMVGGGIMSSIPGSDAEFINSWYSEMDDLQAAVYFATGDTNVIPGGM